MPLQSFQVILQGSLKLKQTLDLLERLLPDTGKLLDGEHAVVPMLLPPFCIP